MTPAQKILNAYYEASDGEWIEEPINQADDWLDSIATELEKGR